MIVIDQCEEGWVRNPFRRTCLWLSSSEYTPGDARIACQRIGGSLAILDTTESRDWLIRLRDYNKGNKERTFQYKVMMIERIICKYIDTVHTD